MNAIRVAFALAHDKLTALQVHILDAQPAAFHEAEAGPVHEPSHQAIRFARRQGVEAGQQRRHFVAGQHDGNTSGASGPEGVDVAEVEMQNVAVEKEQSGEGLVLGTGRNVALHGQEGEKAFDLVGVHRVGMAEPFGRLVEADVLFDPANLATFGGQRQATEAGDMA